MGLGTGVGPRTAVVTGAASPHGIGHATAQRYAEEGWAVVVLDMNGEGVTSAAETIAEDTGAQGAAYAVDVTNREQVFDTAKRIAASDLPPVGALANVAGIPSPVPFLEVTPQLWDRVIAVNLTGVFNTCQAFLPAMIDGGYGRIVNMSSVSAQQGGGVFSKTPYSAAKAGVLGLTRSLAREMAPQGITVNAICPAVVATDIRAGNSAEDEERLTATIPMRRQGTGRDIANMYVWLSSEDAGYVTGTTQSINGGAYIA